MTAPLHPAAGEPTPISQEAARELLEALLIVEDIAGHGAERIKNRKLRFVFAGLAQVARAAIAKTRAGG